MESTTEAAPKVPLAAETEIGALPVYHLKRAWSRALAARCGQPMGDVLESHRDQLVFDALGLGWEQVHQYLLQNSPTFSEFERWIVATAGAVAAEQIERINAALTGAEPPASARAKMTAIDAMEPVLTTADLAHWEEFGYVVVPNAISEETRAAAERAIWEHLGALPDQRESWYVRNDHGIMVQYFQNSAFTAVRRSPRIHKAFAQLWGSSDLWMSTDRVGFNVPERPGWLYRGPHMHWDVSLAQPIPFGTQGILYLTDTPPEQGAFTCVPGFHRRIDAWLQSLPAGVNPREQDLHALGSKPIGGRAADLIIWDHRLPHASSPNRGQRPRIVQYLNMYPTNQEKRQEWL